MEKKRSIRTAASTTSPHRAADAPHPWPPTASAPACRASRQNSCAPSSRRRRARATPRCACAILRAEPEEHAARLVEQPEWVLSEVLLSPDLAPHILAQLELPRTSAHAVKGTCRTWRRAGWKEMLKKRGDDNEGGIIPYID